MKLAFVSPRYGADIGTGPEHACRLFAERLGRRHDVEVLTTCARDPRTWRNEIAEGADRVRGVLVRRFAVSHGKETGDIEELPSGPLGRHDELAWVRRHGPRSPGLLDHLTKQCRGYDALVFFDLQQPATVDGHALAPERTIVFPHLRPGRTLRFGLWRDLLESVRAVAYFSEAERRLARDYVGAEPAQDEVVGIGVGAPTPLTYPRHQQDPDDELSHDELAAPADGAGEEAPPEYLAGRGIPFRRQHRLYGPLASYVGRAGQDNGFEELFEYFDTYAAGDGTAALGLFGVKMMRVPDAPFVRRAGIVPDRQRMAAFEAAEVALVPSPDDVLSLPLLESLATGTPVLASARNAAAVEHCRASGGGLYYRNREEFVEALRLLMNDQALRAGLGESGREYVQQHCRWDAVLPRLDRLLGGGGGGGRHRRHH